jgi:PAS domain S-box-containing protein
MSLRPADFGNRIPRRQVARLSRKFVCLSACLAGTPLPKNGRYNIKSPARGRVERWKSPKLVLLLLGALLLFQAAAPAKVKGVRRVLILNVFGPLSSPGVAVMDEAIVAALQESPYQIELYSEDLEATLFPDEAVQRQFREWYIRKYRDRKPDLIIAVGLEPLRFMVASHETSFSNIPIIFCGSTEEMLGELKLDSHFTGVWAVAQPEETLRAALSLQPGTKSVVVTGGVGAYDRYLEAIARESFRKYESRFEFTYLTDLAMPALIERLKHLPDHTIVYHTSVMQDAAGERFIDASQSVPLIASAARAPVFVVDDVDLGNGTVGGYLVSFAAIGKTVGQMAVRVLSGEKPQDIPIVKSPNVYMYDWPALRRWGLKESNLPPGSLVLHRQPKVWELYGWYIVGSIVLLLFQTLLIFGLLRQRARRIMTESELKLSNDRLHQAVEAGKCVGWDWDVKTGCDRWFGDLRTMFGIQSDTYYGDVEEFRHRIYPEDQALVWEAVADARQKREPFTAEFRVLHLDGTVRWVTEGGQFYYSANGDAVRMLGMAVDITERKQAEQALREGEERFRLVANTAPVLIWMSGTDKLCNYVNQRWLEFTGRPLEDELGNGWAEGVHPEDLKGCMDTYTQAFDRREYFQMEYRLRRHDGQYRWLSAIGVPRFNPDHSFAGYIGSCTDVTEHKLAEESLADMGRKLIEAHEEERTWIARELHDDVNQRMALLAVELDRWNQQLPPSAVELHDHIHHAIQRLSNIATDIQALSHRLHSSKLEYLGLVAAAKSFCRELSEQHQAEIDFRDMAMPRSVPKEISLCLFRVLQEALQNAMKYSGVRHIKVELRGTEGEIQLTVSDLGIGFDPQDAIHRRGLGLISMRERMQLVRGEISINSQPGSGTTIHARVPFSSSSDSVRAAG